MHELKAAPPSSGRNGVVEAVLAAAADAGGGKEPAAGAVADEAALLAALAAMRVMLCEGQIRSFFVERGGPVCCPPSPHRTHAAQGRTALPATPRITLPAALRAVIARLAWTFTPHKADPSSSRLAKTTAAVFCRRRCWQAAFMSGLPAPPPPLPPPPPPPATSTIALKPRTLLQALAPQRSLSWSGAACRMRLPLLLQRRR